MGLRDIIIDVIKKRYLMLLFPLTLTVFWNMTMDLLIPFYYYILVTGNTMYVIVKGNLKNTDTADDVNLKEDYEWSPKESKFHRILLEVISWSTLLLAVMGGWKFLIFGFSLNFFGFMYTKRVAIRDKEYRIKDITWLKNIYTGLLWSPGLILAPYLYVGKAIDMYSIGPMIIALFTVFMIEVFWDVRDVEGDALSGARTIPVVYGLNFTRWFLHLFNLFNLGVILLVYWLGGITLATLSLALFTLSTIFMIEWAFKLESKHFAGQIYVVVILAVLWLGIGIDWMIA